MRAHRTNPGGRSALLTCALVFSACGGGGAPPSKSAEAEDAQPGAMTTEPEPSTDAAEVHPCGQDADQEEPVASGTMGEGPRVVRLINNSGAEIQARLLDAKLAPAIPGTLRVAQGTVGEFRVREGVYYVRYRHRKTCEVRRGQALELTGPRAGVEISIRPQFDDAGKSKMQKVQEPL